jgi:predicted deacylase
MSGIHGDERVGVHATIYFIEALLANAEKSLKDIIHDRIIVFYPLSNSKGFYQNKREENNLDANRDYPFGRGKEKCMMTRSAQIVNEIFRDYLIVGAITFHGGQNSLNWPWGHESHLYPSSEKNADIKSVPSGDERMFMEIA